MSAPESPHIPEPQQPYGVPQQPVYVPPTNGFAVAALVLGILWFSILAVIFGHLAVHRIDRGSGEQGRGMAIAGLVLGWIGIGFWILLFILFFAVVGATGNY